MKFFLIFLILIFSLFLETTLTQIPFVLLSILLFAVLFKEVWIFPAAFLAGIFLDILSFHIVGESSLLFTSMLGIVFLYQRKYEIQSIPFITIFSFCASVVYALLFGQQHAFIDALFVAFFGAIGFYAVAFFNTKAFTPLHR